MVFFLENASIYPLFVVKSHKGPTSVASCLFAPPLSQELFASFSAP